MEFIRVTQDNLAKEHICCAISSEKDCQVISKKNWLKDRFDDGLIFLKGNVRGKCFIEYLPAEKAWIPVDAEYLTYKGFSAADTCEPYFTLMYLPLSEQAKVPSFKPHLKKPERADGSGFVLYYTNQCPFTAKYVPLLKHTAENRGIPFEVIHITTGEEARNAPTPFTTFSLFYNGKFITHEILSEKKFEKIIHAENNCH